MGAFSSIATLICASVALGIATRQSTSPINRGAGEIILKFSAQSRAGIEVARAATDSDVPSAAIESHVSSLGRELGVPLEAKRLGSGGTVIVGLRSAEVPDAIAKRIRHERFVQSVRTVPKSQALDAMVEVQLASGSAEATSLQQRGSDDERSEAVRRVADKLERASGLPLKGVVDRSGRLVLSLELDAAIDRLVALLNKRADIEYAQPNYRARPFGIR